MIWISMHKINDIYFRGCPKGISIKKRVSYSQWGLMYPYTSGDHIKHITGISLLTLNNPKHI